MTLNFQPYEKKYKEEENPPSIPQAQIWSEFEN